MENKNKVNFIDSLQVFYEGEFDVNLLKKGRWELVNTLYEKKEINSGKNVIPKKIHQIWLGSEIPHKYKKMCETWSNIHPDWEYRLWSDNDTEEFGLNNEKFNSIKNLGVKSDILRYHILYKYGGIYADTDFICLKSFVHLLVYDFFGCGGVVDNENNPILFNGLFGCSINNDVINKCIKHLDEKNYTVTNFNVIMFLSGPYFFSKQFFDTIDVSSNVIMLPLSFCYPLPAKHRYNIKDINKWVKEESLSIHLWEQSWQN